MKKLIYGALFLTSIGISFVACKKKEIKVENQINQVSTPPEVTTDGKVLSFKSYEDYDKLVSQNDKKTELEFLKKVNKLKFTSYEEKKKLLKSENDLVGDVFLSQILNEDLCVEIGDWIFKVNKPVEKVYALSKSHSEMYTDLVNENTSNNHILEFSTEDDVFELLGVVNYGKALSKDCQSSNENNNSGWTKYADFTDVNNMYGNGTDKNYKFSVYLRVRYDNWGIYRKLFTEFKHKEAFGGTFNGAYVTIAYQFHYYQKNSSALNQQQYFPSFPFLTNPNYQATTAYDWYADDTKEIQHYRGTKCLRAYVLKSWCWFRDRKTLTPRLYPNNGCLRIEAGGLSTVFPC
jgi:hypothetical protein